MKNEIIKTILNLGILYNKELNEAVVQYFIFQLSDIPDEKVLFALNEYPKTKGARFFPTPYEIRELASGGLKLTIEDEAREIVAKINYAISRCGWTNPLSAKGHIGEVGWKLIEAEGGWQKVCENSSSDDRGIRNAQYRELLKVYLKRDKFNEENKKALPVANQIVGLLNGIINK